MLVWVIHTPLKRQNLFGKQMKKGTSSLKKCNNVPSVQHLRTPSCGGPVAPMGSYLQELNTEPVSTFLRRVHMEDHGNVLFIAFFVWIYGKGETWQAFFQLQNSRISTRNTTQGGCHCEQYLQLFQSIFTSIVVNPDQNYLVYKPESESHKWLIHNPTDRLGQLWPDCRWHSPWSALPCRTLYSASSLLSLFRGTLSIFTGAACQLALLSN